MPSLIRDPLLDIDDKGAKGCLLHITRGPDLVLEEATAMAGALIQGWMRKPI